MTRLTALVGCVALAALVSGVSAAEITGDYIESRTCDVYTGPCFANAEIGQAGREALMAWSIDKGEFNGVDLSGLKVAMAIRGKDTLGFGGGLTFNPHPIKSVAIVDHRATSQQREALVAFAQKHLGEAAGEIVRVDVAPIEMSVDYVDNVGKLKVGNFAEIVTRKLKDCDCVCTNEVVFYPPLSDVEDYTPALNIKNRYGGKGLGVRWSNPQTRSSFLATFAY